MKYTGERIALIGAYILTCGMAWVLKVIIKVALVEALSLTDKKKSITMER